MAAGGKRKKLERIAMAGSKVRVRVDVEAATSGPQADETSERQAKRQRFELQNLQPNDDRLVRSDSSSRPRHSTCVDDAVRQNAPLERRVPHGKDSVGQLAEWIRSGAPGQISSRRLVARGFRSYAIDARHSSETQSCQIVDERHHGQNTDTSQSSELTDAEAWAMTNERKKWQKRTSKKDFFAQH